MSTVMRVKEDKDNVPGNDRTGCWEAAFVTTPTGTTTTNCWRACQQHCQHVPLQIHQWYRQVVHSFSTYNNNNNNNNNNEESRTLLGTLTGFLRTNDTTTTTIDHDQGSHSTTSTRQPPCNISGWNQTHSVVTRSIQGTWDCTRDSVTSLFTKTQHCLTSVGSSPLLPTTTTTTSSSSTTSDLEDPQEFTMAPYGVVVKGESSDVWITRFHAILLWGIVSVAFVMALISYVTVVGRFVTVATSLVMVWLVPCLIRQKQSLQPLALLRHQSQSLQQHIQELRHQNHWLQQSQTRLQQQHSHLIRVEQDLYDLVRLFDKDNDDDETSTTSVDSLVTWVMDYRHVQHQLTEILRANTVHDVVVAFVLATNHHHQQQQQQQQPSSNNTRISTLSERDLQDLVKQLQNQPGVIVNTHNFYQACSKSRTGQRVMTLNDLCTIVTELVIQEEEEEEERMGDNDNHPMWFSSFMIRMQDVDKDTTQHTMATTGTDRIFQWEPQQILRNHNRQSIGDDDDDDDESPILSK